MEGHTATVRFMFSMLDYEHWILGCAECNKDQVLAIVNWCDEEITLRWLDSGAGVKFSRRGGGQILDALPS